MALVLSVTKDRKTTLSKQKEFDERMNATKVRLKDGGYRSSEGFTFANGKAKSVIDG